MWRWSMAKRQRQSELRGCLGGLGYEESTLGCPVCITVCMHVCVCVWGGAAAQTEVPVMSPASLSVDKMSTGGHFKHIIITFYHASATKASSLKCVFTNVPRWGDAGSSAAADGWISSRCTRVVYFVSSGKMLKWKVMRKSTCWARSMPFSHIITEIDLSFPSSHSRLVSIERYYIWNSCIFSFEMYTVLLVRPRN